jgi:hypothetical protein
MTPKPPHRRSAATTGALAAMLLMALGLATAASQAAVSGPVVRLFPTTVLEDIRETGQVAEDMENNLQQIIHKLDMQQELYSESLCAGADGDQGCDRIAKQLGNTYLEMLKVMSDRLPEMERAVNSTPWKNVCVRSWDNAPHPPPYRTPCSARRDNPRPPKRDRHCADAPG